VRVVVIEDDPSISELLVAALQDVGHRVRLARSYDGALRLAAVTGCDAFIIDPFGPGWQEPTGEQRAALHTLAASAPVVVVTGRAWAVTTPAAELGVAAILPKPFDLQALYDALHAIDTRPSRTDPLRDGGREAGDWP
jgi:DNA-binding response OmpR family regulator